MTQEQFVAYHRNQHGPLFCVLTEVRQHVRRYVQCHPATVEISGMPPVPFDGITELWFDDAAGMAALFTAENYMKTIRPDEMKFLDLEACRLIPSTETVLIS